MTENNFIQYLLYQGFFKKSPHYHAQTVFSTTDKRKLYHGHEREILLRGFAANSTQTLFYQI